MLTRLKKTKNLHDLAAILGYKPKSLSYIVYEMPPAAKYTTFEIPKRCGGMRLIHAPVPHLKKLQQRLAHALYHALRDVDDLYEQQHGNKPHKLAHGFTEKYSIVTNAAQHKNRRYVFNIDLLNFFPSIHFGRVRGVFIKDKRFEFNEKIATLIAQIACYENSLPQGAPTSPVISNIVANILDVRLVKLAKKYKCTYSRYADDLTFSTNLHDFPKELAGPDATVPDKWAVGSVLLKEIAGASFCINEQKTRMQFKQSRQVATGLLVNKKVNVVPEYYRSVRSMCASLFKNGTYYLPHSMAMAAQQKQTVADKDIITNPSILAGMLNFVYQVKSGPLKRAMERANTKKEKELAIDEWKESAIYKLYKKFLIFRNFVLNETPVIITEGKTDVVYLKAALKSLAEFYPQLGEIRDKKFFSKLKYLNIQSHTVNEILGISGGSDLLKNFISNHKKELEKFKNKPFKNPVIVLIDNDKGATGIFGAANGLKIDPRMKLSHDSDKDFYHIYENLYIVKTPDVKRPDGFSCIEDFFY